jgi:hypothetical protein
LCIGELLPNLRYLCLFPGKTNAHLVKTWTLDNTEETITNGQSRETGNIGHTRRPQKK